MFGNLRNGIRVIVFRPNLYTLELGTMQRLYQNPTNASIALCVGESSRLREGALRCTCRDNIKDGKIVSFNKFIAKGLEARLRARPRWRRMQGGMA